MSQTSFTVPTAYQNVTGSITTPENSVAQDNAYAVYNDSNSYLQVDTFGFSIPSNAIITGIEVEVQAKATTPSGFPQVDISLSSDDGDSTTAEVSTDTLTASEQTFYVGGMGSLWGRSWTPDDFDDGNFAVEIGCFLASAVSVDVDGIRVRVYYSLPTSFIRTWDLGEWFYGGGSTRHPTTASTTAVDTQSRLIAFNKADFDSDSAEVYFEVLGRNSSAVSVSFELYDVTNAAIRSTITTSSASITRIRSFDLWSSLASGNNEYTVRWYVTSGTGYIYAARLVIKQDDSSTFTKTAGNIFMTDYNTIFASDYQGEGNQNFEPKFTYDSTKWADTNFYLEATMVSSDASGTAYCDLYDETSSSQVSGSERTVTGTTVTRSRSSALTLTDGHVYRVRVKSPSYTSYIHHAFLVALTSAGASVTKFSDYTETWGEDDSTFSGSGTEHTNNTYYIPDAYNGGTFAWFLHMTGKNPAAADTGTFSLRNDTAGSQIADTSWTANAYSVQIDTSITMPTTSSTLDSWTSATGSGQVNVLGGWYGYYALLGVAFETYTADGIIKATTSASATADGIIKATTATSYTVDGIVIEPIGYIKTDYWSVVQLGVTTYEETITADAIIRDLAAVLTDNFDDNSVDSTKWNDWSGVQGDEIRNQFEITSTTAAGYYGVSSQNVYTLYGSSVSIRVKDAGNQSISSFEVWALQVYVDSDNGLKWFIGGGNIRAYKEVATTQTQLATATYSASTHKYLRIRESGGTVYWDYSSNGSSWSNFASETVGNLFALNNLTLEFNIGTWQIEGSTTTAVFDEFNLITFIASQIADGIVKATYTNTYTTDGIIRETLIHSHTADGVVLSAGVWTITADGIIKATYASAHTADGVIRETFIETITADAIIFEVKVSTHTADGIVKEINTETHTADGIIRQTSVATHTADGVIRETLIQSYTVDAVILVAGIATITADGIIRETKVSSITVDAKVAEWFHPSRLVINTGSISGELTDVYYDDDVNLTLNETTGVPGFSYDFIFDNVPNIDLSFHLHGYYSGNLGHLVRLQQYNYTTTTWQFVTTNSTDFPDETSEQVYTFPLKNPANFIQGTQTQVRILHNAAGDTGHHVYVDFMRVEYLYTKTRTADGIILETLVEAITADAIIFETLAETITADAIIFATSTQLHTADGIIFETSAWAVTADGIVRESFAATYTADAIIRETFVETITSDAVIKEVFVETITADGIVFATYLHTYTADALLQGPGEYIILADGIIRETFVETITVDTLIVDVFVSTHTADGFIRDTFVETHTADAIIRETFVVTPTADGIVFETKTTTVMVDAIIRETFVATITGNGIVRETTVVTITSGGIVRETLIQVHTADGIVQQNFIQTITADGVVRETFAETYILDGIIRETFVVTITLDGVVKETLIQSYTVDGMIQGATFVTNTADGFIQETFVETITADGEIADVSLFSHTADGRLIDTRNYTKEAATSLPTDTADLSVGYTTQEYSDVVVSDDIRVSNLGTGRYLIHQYKNRGVASTNNIQVEWEGRSDFAPSLGPVYLQIYNYDLSTWETLDNDSTTGANVDFSLNALITSSQSDYYDPDLWVVCRVYQYSG